MEIRDHILYGDDVKFQKSPNHSGVFNQGDLDMVVLHYTVGPADAAVRHLTNPSTKASAHLVVDRDGSVTQLVPFNTISWHAGSSTWKNRTGINKYSIGIEMANYGPLTKSGDVYRTVYGSTISPNDVIEAIHRNQTRPKYWHAYTEAQIQKIREICLLLIEEYGIKEIVGHEEIAPLRKTDPGPAFPLDRIRSELLNSGSRQSDEGEEARGNGRVTADKLNIRVTPTTDGEKVALPLKKGTKVVIIDEANGWYKVTTQIEGWVSAKFVETV